jgi:hypothetical protein
VEPIDPKKLRDEQFQAEYDALMAHRKAWEKYFESPSASGFKAKLEPPGLESFQGLHARWSS